MACNTISRERSKIMNPVIVVIAIAAVAVVGINTIVKKKKGK